MAELLEGNQCQNCKIVTLVPEGEWTGRCEDCEDLNIDVELSLGELRDLLKQHIWHTFMKLMEERANEVVKMDGHIDLLDKEHLLKLVKDWHVDW